MMPQEAKELMAPMLKKELFVVLRKPADLSRFNEFLAEHLRWAIKAEQRGELFASGPFLDEDAEPGEAGGMSIFRGASKREVRQLLADDPFIKNGVYTADVKKWLLMEGGLTVTLRFSDKSYLLR